MRAWSLCCALAVVAILALPLSADRPEEVSAFESKVAGAWEAAYESGDAERLAALHTEDAVLLPPDQPRVEGREAIQRFFQGMIDAGYRIELTPVEADVAGHLGVRSSDFVLSDASGVELDRGKALEVWRHVEGEWRLWQDTWNSSTPVEAEAAAGTEPVVQEPAGYTWKEIAPGVEFAAVYGDWASESHGKLVRFQPGLASPVHIHSGAYHGMVLSGTVTNPYPGESDPPRLEPSTYWFVPAGMPHVTACVSEEPCLFYTHADSLWDLELIED